MRPSPDSIPETTPTWTAGARRRAPFYLAAALLVALLAGVLTFLYLDRLRASALPTGVALVASAPIRPGAQLQADMLEIRQVPSAILPEGHLTRLDQALGRTAIYPVAANQVLVRGDLEGEDSRLSARLPDGRWAMMLPQSWLMSPLPEATVGDRIDLLAYQPGQPATSVELIVSGVELLSASGPEGVGPLLVAVTLDEARAILYARANAFSLLALLRSRGP